MRVSYGKLTLNDDGDGCLASHNRMLSRGSTRSETAYFIGWKNSLLYNPRFSRSPNF